MSTVDGFQESPKKATLHNSKAFSAVTRLSRRETIVDVSTIFAWVLASDLLIYHSGGYSALALFLLTAAGIIVVARRTLGAKVSTIFTACLLVACALRLAWCGSGGAIASGVVLLLALSMSVNGTPPYLPDMVRFIFHVIGGSAMRISRYSLRQATEVIASPRARFGVLLPLVVVVAFSLLFVRANPDLQTWMSSSSRWLLDRMGQWMQGVDPWQLVFWIASGWLAVGLIYPAADYLIYIVPWDRPAEEAPSELYVAVRNMMISVVLLFAVYLAFEFTTLWFREFPDGFYYAGYAHEGAFWLTVALALATLVLSLAFRGSVLRDPRTKSLRRWAWIWSAENFLLGLAVFHRLFIYIDFNGMTRMRVIGLLGTLSVVIGFALVVYKISQGRGFLWLIRGQLWTVPLAAILYTILPMDYFVHSYNTGQILAGNVAPCTQIPTHETSAEGLIPLVKLLESEDRFIREGIEATLADWLVSHPPATDWRQNQWCHRYLRELLKPEEQRLAIYFTDEHLRQQTMTRFYNYAYQWY